MPCGKWPKFMIACILGPRMDGRRNPIQPPNEMPPCKTNKCGVWTRVCVVIVSAMQVMMRRGGFFCFRLVLFTRRPNELRISSLPCTHSLFPAGFYLRGTFFQSPDSTMHARLDGAHMRRGTGELPVLPQYAPSGFGSVCCLSST